MLLVKDTKTSFSVYDGEYSTAELKCIAPVMTVTLKRGLIKQNAFVIQKSTRQILVGKRTGKDWAIKNPTGEEVGLVYFYRDSSRHNKKFTVFETNLPVTSVVESYRIIPDIFYVMHNCNLRDKISIAKSYSKYTNLCKKGRYENNLVAHVHACINSNKNFALRDGSIAFGRLDDKRFLLRYTTVRNPEEALAICMAVYGHSKS
jgi:hypothetical protein